MTNSTTADAVVVGGGINGAAIAFYLARAGLSRIIIVEAGKAGQGASGRGVGIVRSYYQLEAEASLALLSLRIFQRWSDNIGGTCGYAPTGFMWLASPDAAAGLARMVAMQRRLGADADILSSRDVVALQPHIDPEGIGAAAFESSGGYGDPTAATASLLAAGRRLGVEMRERTPAAALTAKAGRITGVRTVSGLISAPVVILAAGACSAALAATVRVPLPLVATRMTTGTIRHEPFATTPVTFIDAASDIFYRPTAEAGVAYISVRDERHNTALDPAIDWASEVIDPSASHRAIERLTVRIPSLNAIPLRAWAGADGVTPDHRAIYGEAPQLKGLFLCVGGNFKGFKVAPAVGLCLAELVTTGRSGSVDLDPFRLDRFGADSAFVEPPPYSLSEVS